MKLVTWIKCGGDWCSFTNVDLGHANLDNVSGVYIIWQAKTGPNVVRVGQGNIRERLTYQRTNPAVLALANPRLLVTWAALPASDLDGVERYLSNFYSPATGDRWPEVAPIEVNRPA